MALQLLVSVLVHTTPGGDLVNNDVLNVYWDDVGESLSYTKNGGSFTPGSSTQIGDINTNYYTSGITSYEDGYAISGYSFCDGTDLKWFRMVTSYPMSPFMELTTTTDSPVCDVGGGAVCDIHFVGSPLVVHATSQGDGGSITVSATSSNGSVRYGLRNNAYADMTNTTGVFTSVIPGTWAIYAKDANDCTAVVNVTVLYKPTEAEHYRFTWSSLQIGTGTSRDARVRIYEREYVGSVVEVDYADVSPFNLLKQKQGELNNKFYPIHPTSAILRLKSQQDYQFLPLFTQDNKRFKCVYEVDEGSGFTPVWTGFIVPSVYHEDFIATPYTVEIQIADNVKSLEQEPFTDDDGNILFGSLKLVKIIALIMNKTGLSLNIRSGVNIFEENHNTAATDDPLDQTYMDVACYRNGSEPFNCWQVLESILRPFGARIFQYDNAWIIEEIDRAVDEYAYRVFDSDGAYSSNSTFDPIIDVKNPSLEDRAALVDRDHSLEVVPAYGKIDIVSRLNYIGSIVAGGFEKEDLLSPASETFNLSQGVFISEEGFKDWTLRLNGTSGVSFGRVLASNRGDSSRTGLKESSEPNRSVGAFYYNPEQWGGNLRDAYIESAAKNYQYGPGDELKFYFEYSTPARPEYEFMVLRTMIKIGTKYLQPDLTWDTTEAIYRAYPSVSNSLQKFELSVPVPETDVVVDSTIQVRIYYYASGFYDYGLPTNSGDPADGTDGVSGLKALVTDGIDYDYRVDIRHEFTIGSASSYTREFFELRVADTAENVLGGIIRPDDFDGTSNPQIWYKLKMVNVKSDETNANRRGIDLKFYMDNVALDALINGQPPPEEDTISLTISKYINENLEVQLYNSDLPNITNGKNMYNNYFRLSDGTPTSLWSRSGVSESLSLQQILLKVLGANHSAPTFRITGSFINEFSRIGINNYIRITKEGSDLSLSNTTFTSNLNGWSQAGLGESWTWTADNSGSAEVTLSGAEDSVKIYQTISHSGGYFELTLGVKAIPTSSSNNAEDQLWMLFYAGADIIDSYRIITFNKVSSEATYDLTYIALAQENVSRIGFYIRRVNGTGEVNYQVSEFTPTGQDLQEVYQITDYSSEERLNTYTFELMQQSKAYISLGGIDTGGTGQEGSESGGDFNHDFNSDFDGGIN